MSLVTYSFLYILNLFLDTHTFIGIFLQGVLAAIAGIMVYCLAAFLLEVEEMKMVVKKIVKIK